MTRRVNYMTTLAILASAAWPAVAQDPSGEGREQSQDGGDGAVIELAATSDRFLPENGEELYLVACAGCHQPSGSGALGAGAYPPLANNRMLEGGRYPAWIVLNGMGGMPSFGDWLSDEQVVAVVGYIQENLGNRFESNLTSDDVAQLREAPAP